MRAGYFDSPDIVPYAMISPKAVGTAESHALAYDTALQGLVLLRNENDALPFKVSCEGMNQSVFALLWFRLLLAIAILVFNEILSKVVRFDHFGFLSFCFAFFLLLLS